MTVSTLDTQVDEEFTWHPLSFDYDTLTGMLWRLHNSFT